MVPRRNPRNSVSSNEAGDEYTSSEASEIDSFGTAPTWIREELKKSLEAVTKDSVQIKKVSTVKPAEKTKKPTTVTAAGSAQRKVSPGPLRQRNDNGSRVSSSDSSNRSVVQQPVNRLSISVPEKPDKKRRSPSPYGRRSGQTNFNKNRPGRGRVRQGNWESPRPSRSPMRTTDNIHTLRDKVARLQVEKKDAEKKLKEVQDRNENILRELQVRHEKEKLEQERWLHDQIAMLKKQLDEQQREINERELDRGDDSRLSKQYPNKSEPSYKNSSKICSLQ